MNEPFFDNLQQIITIFLLYIGLAAIIIEQINGHYIRKRNKK